ncbi:MAG: hypothetical protein HONDAALG_04245 [Gammaproteobacteria bacterium]|nr:hypothetical protein [Gammaproteobacteria bacterium]
MAPSVSSSATATPSPACGRPCRPRHHCRQQGWEPAQSSTTTPHGALPTAIVATTSFFAVSITET